MRLEHVFVRDVLGNLDKARHLETFVLLLELYLVYLDNAGHGLVLHIFVPIDDQVQLVNDHTKTTTTQGLGLRF